MAQIAANVAQFYNRTMELRDKRVDGWILMDSPLPTLLLCLSYVYGVTSLGPRIMKNRESLNLRKALVAYNFFMVLFSAWLFMELWLSGWGTGYSYRCQPVDFSSSPKAMRMANACWWYYFSKFIEFADTIFFVLRKKFSQVSLLHVIHHGCMPMSVWFGVRFTPGGHSTFFGLLNSLVHVFMYTYYGIAAMGPKYNKFLWWKKYMTTFQLVQFIGIIVHAFQLLFIDCNYPKAFVWWIGGHAVMFFFLFMDFYKQAYLRRRTPNKWNKDAVTNGHVMTNGHTTKAVVANGSSVVANGVVVRNNTTHVHENGHSKLKSQ